MSHIRIIIPFYQSEATLERALLSIQKQTERNFECFLVNNHSTDGFQRVITPFLKDSRFSLVHEKKQGVSYAFNRGLEGATCPYIARMDADDEVLPERLEKQKEYLEQHQDIDMVGSQARHVPGSFFSEGLKRFVEWNNQILSPEDIQQHQFIETPVINPTAMFRRNSLEKFGSYIHGDFPEDYELWLRW
ncbi:MAG: glycosyltransferase family 2 protein [Bacteroidota bacterium]